MVQINDNFLKLRAGYLFPEIARRVNAFCEQNPDADVIRLGIGDVTEPQAIVQAMHDAVHEMSQRESFRGYGPEQGYSFLQDAITAHDYQQRGIDISADEIFISDGSKCDTGNILDIFGPSNTVAITDPVYPVYVDTNVMAGRTGVIDDAGHFEGIVYLPITAENDFVPSLPEGPVDLIYLCYPNNPTGTVLTHSQLKSWVDYARQHESLILYDAAYEAFISQDSIPRSIYEIDGAKEVAIEFRSFSKTAGFTGVRCAFTVVPRQLQGRTSSGEPRDIHSLWDRRQSTKFNGASFVVQRGAAALYTPQGQAEVGRLINFYMTNARLLRDGLRAVGMTVYGGINAPYVWLRTPPGTDSWSFFDRLLERGHLVGTPGAGFGPGGAGYFRLSAFNSRTNIERAVERFGKVVS